MDFGTNQKVYYSSNISCDLCTCGSHTALIKPSSYFVLVSSTPRLTFIWNITLHLFCNGCTCMYTCVFRRLFMCVALCVGVCQGVRKRVSSGQTQVDAQWRTEVRVYHVREGFQEAGPLVSFTDIQHPHNLYVLLQESVLTWVKWCPHTICSMQSNL